MDLKRLSVMITYGFAAVMVGCAATHPGKDNIDTGEPIRITGLESVKLDFSRTDGGLELASGVETFVVFRADRENPKLSDGMGWTYHHHPDIACWQGRMYVGWDSCEVDEDTWPSRELYSTSTDGKKWAPPAELFPQGVSLPLRMYFFLAPNGRMLVIAGLRENLDKTSERKKGSLVVREIYKDHKLGEVFTLRPPQTKIENQPPLFDTSKDTGFILACQQLLADHLYLEQQDYGKLLDPKDRMKWHDPNNWTGDEQLLKDAYNFGGGMCFYKRADGALVSISKRRWVTVSEDGGKTWPQQPVRPSTLITNMGKVWGQQVPDGRYILVYDPDLKIRYPLAIVTGDDGITFGNMQVIHGLLGERRYPGLHKSPGSSYIRGLSKWNNDGSFKDDAVWFVYSVNKEDIWVSRLPWPK
jgi:hypothetical protein